MAEQEPTRMSWEGWKWGPASVIGGIGIMITVGSLLVGIGVMKAAVNDSETAVREIRLANEATAREFRAANELTITRLVRLETKIDLLMTSAPGKKPD